MALCRERRGVEAEPLARRFATSPFRAPLRVRRPWRPAPWVCPEEGKGRLAPTGGMSARSMALYAMLGTGLVSSADPAYSGSLPPEFSLREGNEHPTLPTRGRIRLAVP